MSARITVAYSGVHQAYQIALAAQEGDLLDRFYCSFFDAPGKWGKWLAWAVGADALASRRMEGLDLWRVVECPWFELGFKLQDRFMSVPGNAWIGAAQRFDAWVAPRLRKSSSRLFVGVENCAFASFQVAKEESMICFYDCPGYDASTLSATTEAAADMLGLKVVSVADTQETTRRKAAEREMADIVLACSEAHAVSLRRGGVPADKLVTIPLWIDSERWYPSLTQRRTPRKLRALYAGNVSLRKGVPFLLRAVDACAGSVELTLIGQVNEDMRGLLDRVSAHVRVMRPVSKPKLRGIYCEHDVLVLPSLGDSFGFVGLEAMACGLPVIVTENCGVPVPDPRWRVPVMNAEVIAARLHHYAGNRNALEVDRLQALEFARRFTPRRYRDGIGQLMQKLIADRPPRNS